MINVSDDDDLLSAYEVAQKDLSGNLKLVVKFKSQPVEETSELICSECAEKPQYHGK